MDSIYETVKDRMKIQGSITRDIAEAVATVIIQKAESEESARVIDYKEFFSLVRFFAAFAIECELHLRDIPAGCPCPNCESIRKGEL